jgi:hypothetical protein
MIGNMENPIQILRALVDLCGSNVNAARHLGVSPAYVSDVLTGRREPGKGILEPMGLERVVTYRKKRAR